MIGRVRSLSTYGLFIDFQEKGQSKRGLMHWSELGRGQAKPKKQDLIDVKVLKSHEDGKIDLTSGELGLLEVLAQFNDEAAKKLEALSEKNKESLGY